MRLANIEKYYFRPIKKNRGKTATLTAMSKNILGQLLKNISIYF